MTGFYIFRYVIWIGERGKPSVSLSIFIFIPFETIEFHHRLPNAGRAPWFRIDPNTPLRFVAVAIYHLVVRLLPAAYSYHIIYSSVRCLVPSLSNSGKNKLYLFDRQSFAAFACLVAFDGHSTAQYHAVPFSARIIRIFGTLLSSLSPILHGRWIVVKWSHLANFHRYIIRVATHHERAHKFFHYFFTFISGLRSHVGWR